MNDPVLREVDDATGHEAMASGAACLVLDARQPQMLDHQRTAEARGIITTASYAQVTQPLYRGAVGRWRRYSKHLEPILPTLAPWIEKLGYEL